MSPRILELLDLAFRWVHVIAGIMWIGNSLLFNWLDRNLDPASRGGSDKHGEIWLLHSGGFYFVEKTSLAGQPLPRRVHWFKWQAYITWLSGAALLLVVYYFSGRALLTDPTRAAITPGVATAVALGSLVVGQVVYDVIWRSVGRRSTGGAAAVSIVALVGLAVALTNLLSGRAAFLHMGALLATIMAANVAHVIMPSQRRLESAVATGLEPDPTVAANAKTRSIHNNYLTFPVVVLMLSTHFPGVYGHRLNWLALLILVAVGMAVRHLLNIRYTVRHWVPAFGLTTVSALAALLALPTLAGIRDQDGARAATAARSGPVSFAEARSIVDRRCTACHSTTPSITEFGPAPGGVSFDDPQRIQSLATRIQVRAIDTRTMPVGNRTHMTEAERAALARWIADGAGR